MSEISTAESILKRLDYLQLYCIRGSVSTHFPSAIIPSAKIAWNEISDGKKPAHCRNEKAGVATTEKSERMPERASSSYGTSPLVYASPRMF